MTAVFYLVAVFLGGTLVALLAVLALILTASFVAWIVMQIAEWVKKLRHAITGTAADNR